MSFGYVTDLPRFENYNQALAYFNKTKGMRGREHIKPLKTTRRCPDDYRIDKRQDGGIECWLYKTPVLTFYPDSIVINTFDSRTTCSFVDSIAPSWVWSNINQGTQVISVIGEGMFIGPRVEISVECVYGVYTPVKGSVKASKLEQVILNKQRATESRKQCKEVVELARVTSKIDGYWDALNSSTEPVEDEAMQWLKNVLRIGKYYQHQRWNGSISHTGFGSWGEQTAEGLLPRLKQRLYKMTYTEHDCYDYIPAPYGTLPKVWRTAR